MALAFASESDSWGLKPPPPQPHPGVDCPRVGIVLKTAEHIQQKVLSDSRQNHGTLMGLLKNLASHLAQNCETEDFFYEHRRYGITINMTPKIWLMKKGSPLSSTSPQYVQWIMVQYSVDRILRMPNCTGGRSALATTNPFVFFVPVFLLTPNTAVRGVPAAMVHGFLFTVETLKHSRQWLVSAEELNKQQRPISYGLACFKFTTWHLLSYLDWETSCTNLQGSK